MSKAPRRFDRRIYGTMHESPHGDWVRYGDLALATQRAEAAEAERDRANVAAAWCAEQADKDATEAMQLRAEREALRKAVDAVRATRTERDAVRTVDDAMVGRFLRAYAECESERPQTFTHRMGVRAALDAALAVQP